MVTFPARVESYKNEWNVSQKGITYKSRSCSKNKIKTLVILIGDVIINSHKMWQRAEHHMMIYCVKQIILDSFVTFYLSCCYFFRFRKIIGFFFVNWFVTRKRDSSWASWKRSASVCLLSAGKSRNWLYFKIADVFSQISAF